VRARRLSVRALWGFASWALPLALIFVVTPSLVHALGPARFGIVMLIFVTPLLASQLDLGICSSAVRRLASALASGRVCFGSTLYTYFAVLGAVGIVLALVVWLCAAPLGRWLGFAATLGDAPSTELVRWCAAWMAVTMLTLLPGLLARAAQALAWTTVVQTLSAAAMWTGSLALARAGRPLSEVVALGLAVSVAAAAATAFAMRRHVDWTGPLRFDRALMGVDARFSAGMFAAQVAGALLYQGDRILASALGSPAIAGAYALCANIASKVVSAAVALTSFAFPHAAGLSAQGDRDRLAALLHALDRGVIVLIAPVLLPGTFLAGPFLGLWLGEYASDELAFAFRILWIGFAINAFAVPVSSILFGHGNAGLAARFAWLTTGIVIGSIVLLVPLWGLRGAAIAMFLGMATSPAFNIVARRTLALAPPPGRRRFWLGIACGLAAQLAVLTSWHESSFGWLQLFLAGAAAVGVFYLTRAIFGLLSPEEERSLRRLLAGLRHEKRP
jgi:O-antigen/teichoic acid export membrane protein